MCKRGLASSTFLKLRSSSFVCAAAPMTGVSWDFVFIAVCVLYTAGSMVWELHISPECARRTARYARVEAHCRAQKNLDNCNTAMSPVQGNYRVR